MTQSLKLKEGKKNGLPKMQEKFIKGVKQ